MHDVLCTSNWSNCVCGKFDRMVRRGLQSTIFFIILYSVGLCDSRVRAYRVFVYTGVGCIYILLVRVYKCADSG